MGRIAALKPHEVQAILEKLGFCQIRQKGSHIRYRHEDGRSTTLAYHKGRDVSPILLRQIAGDIGMTVEELVNLR